MNQQQMDSYKNNVQIVYQGKTIQYGENVPLNNTKSTPTVNYAKSPGKFYTVIMVDPDAPSPANPTKKYYLHYLVVNQSANSTGDTINQYTPPNPPEGTHRYYTCVLEQKAPIKGLREFKRENFNVTEFTSRNNLNLIGCTKFESHK